MSTDPRLVLAAAMGKEAPTEHELMQSNSIAEHLKFVHQGMLPGRFMNMIARDVLLGCVLLLLVWLTVLMIRARRRYVGYQQAPLALDYKTQRRQLSDARAIAAANDAD